MKKLLVFVCLAVLLTGCGAAQTFETVADVYAAPAAAIMREVRVELPPEAAAVTVHSEDAGTIYFCNGYTVTLQTMASGDLDATLRTVTGFGRDALTVLQTRQGACTRYDLVWAAQGENGDQMGRAAVLDDGNYHYVLTAMTDADREPDLEGVWEQIFGSFWAV